MVAFREHMWRQGTSCVLADRATAEAAITDAYAVVKLPKPKIFWMPSPMTCALALYVLQRFADDATKHDRVLPNVDRGDVEAAGTRPTE